MRELAAMVLGNQMTGIKLHGELANLYYLIGMPRMSRVHQRHLMDETRKYLATSRMMIEKIGEIVQPEEQEAYGGWQDPMDEYEGREYQGIGAYGRSRRSNVIGFRANEQQRTRSPRTGRFTSRMESGSYPRRGGSSRMGRPGRMQRGASYGMGVDIAAITQPPEDEQERREIHEAALDCWEQWEEQCAEGYREMMEADPKEGMWETLYNGTQKELQAIAQMRNP